MGGQGLDDNTSALTLIEIQLNDLGGKYISRGFVGIL